MKKQPVWSIVLENNSAIALIKQKMESSKNLQSLIKPQTSPEKPKSIKPNILGLMKGGNNKQKFKKKMSQLTLGISIFKWVGKAKAKLQRFRMIQEEIRLILDEAKFFEDSTDPDLNVPDQSRAESREEKTTERVKLEEDIKKFENSVYVQQSLKRWWSLLYKGSDERFSISHLHELNALIYKFLTPGISIKDAKSLAIRDTEIDLKSYSVTASSLEYSQFFTLFVELALSWCPSQDEKEIVMFLEAIRKKINSFLYPFEKHSEDPDYPFITQFQKMDVEEDTFSKPAVYTSKHIKMVEAMNQSSEFSENVKKLVKHNSFLVARMNVANPKDEKTKNMSSSKKKYLTAPPNSRNVVIRKELSISKTRDRNKDDNNFELVINNLENFENTSKKLKNEFYLDEKKKKKKRKKKKLRKRRTSDILLDDEEFLKSLFFDEENVTFPPKLENSDGFYNEIVFDDDISMNDNTNKFTSRTPKNNNKASRKKKLKKKRSRSDCPGRILKISEVRRFRKKVYERNRKKNNLCLARSLGKVKSHLRRDDVVFSGRNNRGMKKKVVSGNTPRGKTSKSRKKTMINNGFPTLENIIRLQQIQGGAVGEMGFGEGYSKAFVNLCRLKKSGIIKEELL